MRKLTVYPSLASANQLSLAGEIDRVASYGRLHLDIEDGVFVPNITFGMRTVRQVAEYAAGRMQLDAHLLVCEPKEWIAPLATCGITRIAVHLEALRYPLEALRRIRDSGLRAGLALNFATPAEVVRPFLEELDYVIVMTAEPDGGEMRFRPAMLEKLRLLSGMLEGRELWADGGVNAENMEHVTASGATAAVLGRAVFSQE